MCFSRWAGGMALSIFLAVSSASQTVPRPDLTLRFLGHASFEWVTPTGTRIIIDPYDDSWWSHWFNRSFPQVPADFALVTHPHFDHDAVRKIAGEPQVLREAGVREGDGYTIRAVTGHHARSDKYGHRNLIFVIDVGGIRFCHWGDNDAHLTDEIRQEIGRVDVLMLPVDGSEHLLTLEEVAFVIQGLSPRVVVPMHYFEANLTSVCSTLLPIDNWLNRQNNVRRIPAGEMKLSPSELPRAQQIWVFTRFAGYPSTGDGRDNTIIPCRLQARGPQLLGLYFVFGGLVAGLSRFRWCSSKLGLGKPSALSHRALVGIITILFWPLVLLSWFWDRLYTRSRYSTGTDQ